MHAVRAIPIGPASDKNARRRKNKICAPPKTERASYALLESRCSRFARGAGSKCASSGTLSNTSRAAFGRSGNARVRGSAPWLTWHMTTPIADGSGGRNAKANPELAADLNAMIETVATGKTTMTAVEFHDGGCVVFRPKIWCHSHDPSREARADRAPAPRGSAADRSRDCVGGRCRSQTVGPFESHARH